MPRRGEKRSDHVSWADSYRWLVCFLILDLDDDHDHDDEAMDTPRRRQRRLTSEMRSAHWSTHKQHATNNISSIYHDYSTRIRRLKKRLKCWNPSCRRSKCRPTTTTCPSRHSPSTTLYSLSSSSMLQPTPSTKAGSSCVSVLTCGQVVKRSS